MSNSISNHSFHICRDKNGGTCITQHFFGFGVSAENVEIDPKNVFPFGNSLPVGEVDFSDSDLHDALVLLYSFADSTEISQ